MSGGDGDVSQNEPRDWTGVALPVALTVAAVASFIASITSRSPLRAGALVAALAALAAVLALWVSSVRAGRRAAAEARDMHIQTQRDLDTLREAAAGLESTLASLEDGVVLFTSDGRVAHANTAVKDLLGRRFETITELVPSALRDAVHEASAGGQSVLRELTMADRTVLVEARPSSPPGAVVLLVRDVTNARRVEQLRRDFVANASHELKTPVASIVALSETLTSAADDRVALVKFLGLLQQEATRLASLVQDLLDLSRLEGGPLERRQVRLDLVVSVEADRLRPRAAELGLHLLLEPTEATVVSGAESDLGVMAHNVLDNAIRYTPKGGQVRVSLTSIDGRAVLRVDDTGIGIPSRDLDRVFERFYLVDEARSRETGGTGLGLSIVRHVAEAHGGTASVRSVLGAGSTFFIEIPLATEG